MPYFFQIRENKRVYGVDEDYGSDGYVWINKDRDGTVESDRKSMLYAIEQDDVEFDENIADDQLEELMEDIGYEKGYFRNEEVYSNAFLSEKSCKRHIQLNNYHYSEPIDYLTHAFRNPDMELLFEFLCSLTGKKVHI